MIDKWSDGERSWKGGALAGLFGGASMALLTMITSAALGHDAWLGLKVPSALFFGESAFQTGFAGGPVLVGLLVHLAISAGWGVLFAFLAFGLSRAMTVAAGAGFGVLVWLATISIALPILGLGELIRSIPLGFAVLEHLLFGLTLGVAFLAFQRSRARFSRTAVSTA